MPYLTIRATPHYYEWIGVGSDGAAPQVLEQPVADKPAMVFLHGWGGSARYWRSTALALAPHFNCLLYDLRGFGRSQLPVAAQSTSQDCDLITTYALETYAEDLVALLDGLGLQRVYLNAHSTGSSIAVLFLNRYAERVEKAILTCNGIFEYDERAFSQFHQFGGYVVKFRPKWLAKIPGIDRMFMARFLSQPVPSSERKAFLDDFLMADEAAALGTMYTAVSKEAALTMPSEFSQLKVPTLLVAGEFDQIIPAEMGQKAAQLSENVEFAVIPKTGHFPMLEDASTYLENVLKFLDLAPVGVVMA